MGLIHFEANKKVKITKHFITDTKKLQKTIMTFFEKMAIGKIPVYKYNC